MRSSTLDEPYFEWMYGMMCNDEHLKRESYISLFRYLNDTEFTYDISMNDGNRWQDGIDLRYSRFSDYIGIEPLYMEFASSSCSVLEMMIALAIRLEEHIMHDPDIGDRTTMWFWGMIDSMGLSEMDDSEFNLAYVEAVVQRFLDRDYRPDGKGGLFTIEECKYDLRKVEIWYQACWYLDTLE